MLFASTPADKAILPTAWGGRYFFNRIGQKLSFGVLKVFFARCVDINNPALKN